MIDRCAALVLLCLLSPIVAAIWLMVRLTSSGCGIYSQVRVGCGGKAFRIYKLRTMYHEIEKTEGGAKWSTRQDPRVTPLGRILRKLHLDELPQLWNVLKGDMSLVGPRPERPEFVVPLSREIRGYTKRLDVRPGVTGLAQIQLPPDSDLLSVARKLSADLSYIRHRGFWLDLRLLLGTMIYLVGFSYSRVHHLMRLPGYDEPAVTFDPKKVIEPIAIPTTPR